MSELDFTLTLVRLLRGDAAADAYLAEIEADNARAQAVAELQHEADLAQFRAAIAADPSLFFTYGL